MIEHLASGAATITFTNGNSGTCNYNVDLSDDKATQTKPSRGNSSAHRRNLSAVLPLREFKTLGSKRVDFYDVLVPLAHALLQESHPAFLLLETGS